MLPLGEVPWVELNDNVSEMMTRLYEFRKTNRFCNTAVAVDGGKPVGLVTVRSIFEKLEPEAFHISQWSVPVFWTGLWTERIQELMSTKVLDIFVPIKMVGVQADSSLMRAVHCFNKTKTPALAVLDHQNVIGVLEMSRVFEELILDGGKGS